MRLFVSIRYNFITHYRQMHLGQFLRQLTRLAEEFGIAVVITNQVQPYCKSHAQGKVPTNFLGCVCPLFVCGRS